MATAAELQAEISALKTIVEKFVGKGASKSGATLFATPADKKLEGQGRFKSLPHFMNIVRKKAMSQATPDELGMLHETPKVIERWAVAKGWSEEAIQKATGMSEGAGPDGGDLLMPTWAEAILEIQHDFDDILSRCDKYEMPGPSMKFRAVDETSLASTRRGGVLGYWPDEGATLTPSKPKVRVIDIIPHKVIVLMYETSELQQDSPIVENMMQRYAAEELAWQINAAIISGTGAGKPLGILNAACAISVAKESGQASGTVVSENITKMAARLHASSRKRAVWFINQDVQPALDVMTLASGGGVSVLTYMAMDQGITKVATPMLKGMPIIEIPWASTLGTVGDIILTDLKQYLAATRGSILSATSIHVAFLTDESAWRWTQRIGGCPWWSQALTPANGTNTQSPIVVLASR